MTDNPCPPGTVWLGCHTCGGRPVCVDPAQTRHVSAPRGDERAVPWLVGATPYPSYPQALAASLAIRAAGGTYDQFRIRPAPAG